jgi:hypothetical protein
VVDVSLTPILLLAAVIIVLVVVMNLVRRGR